MKLLVVSGSARRDSLNSQLARLVAQLRPADTVTVVTDLTDLPYYNADLEAAGTPPAVVELRAAVYAADAIVIVTPEYNGTVPGMLGNAIDWLSRPPRHSVLRAKPALVLYASPGRRGGTRGAARLREVLERIGANVFPDGLSVAAADQQLGASPDPLLVADLVLLLGSTLDRQLARVAA